MYPRWVIHLVRYSLLEGLQQKGWWTSEKSLSILELVILNWMNADEAPKSNSL